MSIVEQLLQIINYLLETSYNYEFNQGFFFQRKATYSR